MYIRDILPEKEISPERKAKKRKWIFRSFLVVGVFFLLFLGYVIWHTAKGVTQIIYAAQSTALQVENFEIASIEDSFLEVEEGVGHLDKAFQALRIVEPLPMVGDQVEGSRLMIEIVRESVGIARDGGEILAGLLEVIEDNQEVIDQMVLAGGDEAGFFGLPQSVRIALIQRLRQSQKELDSIQTRIHIIGTMADELDKVPLKGFLADGQELLLKVIPQAEKSIDEIIPFIRVSGEVLGVPNDRQWLLLFLNTNEIRPGGGFIGAYGLMLMQGGNIETLSVDDSYSVDKLVEGNPILMDAPGPIQDYTGVQKWYFRDANWSPDFAVSAHQAMTVLQTESRLAGLPVPQVDGVIGVTPQFVAALLEVIGPVEVEGVEYTEENIAILLQEEVEFGYEDRGEDFTERKQIIGRVMETILAKVFTLWVDDWGRLFVAFSEQIEKKNIALYSTDEGTQQIFSQVGWSGELPEKLLDDTLFVVDANMVANKTDIAIDREIHYTLTPVGDRYRADVEIYYTHNSPHTDLITNYRTFTRVYAPLGSTLISVEGGDGSVVKEDELGLSSFGTFLQVPVEGEADLVFSYFLPSSVKEAADSGLYQLRVLKQLGMEDIPLTLDLSFGKNILSALPGEEKEEFGDQRYHVESLLGENQVYTVQF